VIVQPLASGSKGNAVWIEHQGTRLLFDAGLPGPELVARARSAEREPKRLNAIFLSHLHLDHARGLRRAAKVSGAPVFLHRAHSERGLYRGLGDVRSFTPGEPREIGSLRVEAFAVSHDAIPTVGFVVQTREARFGFATDLGCGDELVVEKLSGCDALYLEFNHDEQMLWHGPYPGPLKERIAGMHGHLSNAQAERLLERLAGERLRFVFLAHLSETNNTPELALAAARRALQRAGREAQVELRIALQHAPTPPHELGELPASDLERAS
jgi:phosphoribosyl 1,2-cyclic phosphodiesterase